MSPLELMVFSIEVCEKGTGVLSLVRILVEGAAWTGGAWSWGDRPASYCTGSGEG